LSVSGGTDPCLRCETWGTPGGGAARLGGQLAVEDAGRGLADHAAEDDGALVHAGEREACLLEQVGGNDCDQADAHVEGTKHLVLIEAAEFLKMREEGWWIPGREVDLGGQAAGQDAGKVFGEASAGDVGEAADDLRLDELANGGEVAAMGTHESCSDLVAEFVDVLFGAVVGGLEQQLEGERVAGGVEAVGGQAEKAVAFADGIAGEQAGAGDDAGEEAGEFVVGVAVEPGGLGGFATEEGAGVGFAGVDEAADDLLDDVGIDVAGGEVVEEEEGRGALDGDVVDAVIDEVRADAGVEAELDGELELTAHAVGGGDQDGVGEAFGVESEETGEASDFAEHLLVEGAAGEAFDAVVGEDVAIGGDDGVVVAAGSAGFFVDGGSLGCGSSG
jgi:hypothetical protein